MPVIAATAVTSTARPSHASQVITNDSLHGGPTSPTDERASARLRPDGGVRFASADRRSDSCQGYLALVMQSLSNGPNSSLRIEGRGTLQVEAGRVLVSLGEREQRHFAKRSGEERHVRRIAHLVESVRAIDRGITREIRPLRVTLAGGLRTRGLA